MVWQVRIYHIFKNFNRGNFILNVWCIENTYKQKDMQASRFLKFSTYSMVFFW